MMIIWLQTLTTDLGAGNGKAESVLAGGGKLDSLDLGHVLVLGDGHLNLNRGGGSNSIGVAESSVSESVVAKAGISETGVSESIGKDRGKSRGSLGGLLVSGPLPAGLTLLEAGDGVAEVVLAAGVDGGILDHRHGNLNLVHHGLGHGVGVAGIAVGVASKATIGQNNLGQENLASKNSLETQFEEITRNSRKLKET